MSRKIIVSIIVLSIAFLELLAVRQAQINTVHHMAQLHRAIERGNDEIHELSIKIEFACSPNQLQQRMALQQLVHEQP